MAATPLSGKLSTPVLRPLEDTRDPRETLTLPRTVTPIHDYRDLLAGVRELRRPVGGNRTRAHPLASAAVMLPTSTRRLLRSQPPRLHRADSGRRHARLRRPELLRITLTPMRSCHGDYRRLPSLAIIRPVTSAIRIASKQKRPAECFPSLRRDFHIFLHTWHQAQTVSTLQIRGQHSGRLAFIPSDGPRYSTALTFPMGKSLISLDTR